MGTIAIATTTFYKDPHELQAKLAYETAGAARLNNIPLVVVDGGSPDVFIKKIKKLEAIVFKQTVRGMGPGRRQALAEAAKLARPDGIVLWMEPEKYPLVDGVQYMARTMQGGNFDLGIPARRCFSATNGWNPSSFCGYPEEQGYAECLGNLAFSYFSRKPLDIWFGPRAIRVNTALRYFLDYKGEYGDKWDSIVIPILRALHKGCRIENIYVSYTHPKEQTAEEVGNFTFIMKRIEQLQNLLPAIHQEAQKLGIS